MVTVYNIGVRVVSEFVSGVAYECYVHTIRVHTVPIGKYDSGMVAML